MSFIVDGIKHLSYTYHKQKSSENFKIFSAVYRLSSISTDSLDNFFNWLNSKYLSQDTLNYEVKIGHASAILFSPASKESFNEKVGLLKDAIDQKDQGDEVVLTITIRKKLFTSVNINEINIYSLEDFGKYLDRLMLTELAKFLPKASNNGYPVRFNILHDVKECKTARFLFRSSYPTAQDVSLGSFSFSQKERTKKVEKRDKCGHFASAELMDYLPEDFMLEEKSINNDINSVLNGLLTFYLLVFLCDFSKVSAKLTVRMKGYKLISQDFTLAELKECNTNELWEIYKWVFTEGNYTDKVGLARNLISIHLQNDNLLTLDEGTIYSLESGYDIYLKENVKQYIELKNKLSEFIQSSSDKANSVTQNMFTSMKNSLWGFVSFFLSVIFLRVISKGTFNGIVTNDILIISYGILSISLVLLWVSLKETNADESRFKQSYSSLKDRYKDLLDSNDLNRILQNDKVHKADLSYISSKKKLYRNAWLGITLVMGLVVTSLWYFNPLKAEFNSKSSTIKTKQAILPNKIEL